eukprot:PLAT3680.3.p2 GENE.PLAT3680.3~~PLAT3680.3.p2  ORF type:complete len:197 (+),score=92.39 PLAT3680.3:1-591(+)
MADHGGGAAVAAGAGERKDGDDGDAAGYTVVDALDGWLRDIGDEGVWLLSSAKPGSGIRQLRDDSRETYWQSDGGKPHLVNVRFFKKQYVEEVALLLDYKLDETYTPERLVIRAGSTYHDLRDVASITLEEPIGWVRVPLGVRAWYVQLAVLRMHSDGRDTHVRCMKLRGRAVGKLALPALPDSDCMDMRRFGGVR